MPIDITGEFQPSDGVHGFDLYDPQDIKAGNVNVALQAIAGGSFKGGSHATAPVGEIVVQVRTTTGTPNHSATEGTLCWNSVDNTLWVNNNGATAWTQMGPGTVTSVTGTAPIASTGGATPAISLNDGGVTFAKMQTVAASVILGNDAAGTAIEALSPTAARTVLNVADGANNYVHPNHSGDVTSVADGAQTIAADAVTYAKMQNVSAASKLLGRGSAAGAGDPEEITLGTNLSMSGTTLNAAGGGASLPVVDTTSIAEGSVDATKEVRLECDTLVPTATVVVLTVPAADGTIARLADKLSAFAATTSAELAGVISDETGSGALVFATSPTLVTPNIGDATANSVTGLVSPTGGSNAANKDYVDGLANGLDWKASVRVATVVAGTLTTDFENGDTVDGVVLVTGDRILIKDQALPRNNGIWVVAASGSPSRATDADSSAEVTSGMSCLVSEGTENADKVFVLTTNDPIVLGTTSLTFTASFSGIPDGAVTLAKMANLAQDQFIGRVTASTGVPETATITATARTVLDDTTVAAMVDTLGGASSTGTGGLVRATSPTLVTPLLSGKVTLEENASIALDPAGSADGKYSGITVTGTAGYAQAFGDVVYKDPTDSRWELCDADSAPGNDGDSHGVIGMVAVAGTDGNACTILLQGIIRADAKFPTFVINGAIYVSGTAGAVTQTAPTTYYSTVMRVVGFALTADEMYFNPSQPLIVGYDRIRYLLCRIVGETINTAIANVVGGDVESPVVGVITEVGAYVDTAGLTGVSTIDINKNGTTILSTKITIDSNEKSSRTAATSPVISVTSLGIGDVLTFDIDGISTTAAKGLTVWVAVRENYF
jgi:hypothetical protein